MNTLESVSRGGSTNGVACTSKSSDNQDTNANVGLSDIGSSTSTQIVVDNTEKDSLTSWREKIKTSIARSRKIKGGNYVQIATVDPKTMEPRCRTVVFRGFLHEMGQEKNEDGYVMKMITDLRSHKVSEVTTKTLSSSLPNQNNVELVWWFSKSSEQYRIRGKLEFIGDAKSHTTKDENSTMTPTLPLPDDGDAKFQYWSKLRKEQWGNLSDMAREQFYWDNPGIPYDNHDSSVPTGGRGEDGKVLDPPENFLLMMLHPTHIDYLRLSDNFRQIDRLLSEGEGDNCRIASSNEWTCERVNP